MNIIILLGRLTKKPEIKYSQANNVKIAMNKSNYPSTKTERITRLFPPVLVHF